MNKLIYFFILTILIACNSNSTDSSSNPVDVKATTQKFNAALDSMYHYHVSLSPVRQSYEGLKTNNDKWGVSNDSVSLFYYEMNKGEIAFIKESFKLENLEHQAQLTYRMYLEDLDESIYNYDNWRNYYYPVNQMFGSHTWFPTF